MALLASNFISATHERESNVYVVALLAERVVEGCHSESTTYGQYMNTARCVVDFMDAILVSFFALYVQGVAQERRDLLMKRFSPAEHTHQGHSL